MNSQTNRTESLFELAAVLGQQNDFQEILRLLSLHAAALFETQVASIVMINPGTQNTVKTVIHEGAKSKQQRYHLAQTNMIGWVTKNKQPFLTEDLKSDSRFSKDILEDFVAVESAMCVPLRSGGGFIGYILTLNKGSDGKFAESELQLLEKMSTIAAPHLSNAQKVQEFFNKKLPDSTLLDKYEALGLLGRSPAFVELLKAIEAAARCDVRVLLEGNTGTGKELIARAIHRLSARGAQPFVAIDCGAIPAQLVESELFGHVKGAYTGANRDRIGLFQEADGGTLFMDEIANLPLEMQAKLMRVLQEGEVRPLGSNKVQQVNVRVISASSGLLQELVAEQKFREDLYYRLLVYPIKIPSLAERRADILLLANHFLKKFAAQQKKSIFSFGEQVLVFLRQRKWQGNIRELENLVERVVAFVPPEEKSVEESILPPGIKEEFQEFDGSREHDQTGNSFGEKLQNYEKELLIQALIDYEWNQSAAAVALEMPEPTLRYKMNKLGITRPE